MCNFYSTQTIYKCDPRAASYNLTGRGIATYSLDTANTNCLGQVYCQSLEFLSCVHHAAFYNSWNSCCAYSIRQCRDFKVSLKGGNEWERIYNYSSLINIITHKILYLWLLFLRLCFRMQKGCACIPRQTFTTAGNCSRWNVTAHYTRLLWSWVRLSL
jgi:hypothetical protein